MIKNPKKGSWFLLIIFCSNILIHFPVLAQPSFILQKGIWIEYEDWWSEEKISQMEDYSVGYRIDITSVEGNIMSYTWTLTSFLAGAGTGNEEIDIESGYWEKGIPPESNVGDKISSHQDSPVIQEIIERTYAGKERMVLFFEEEQDMGLIEGKTLVKYYWDKKTGILLEWWTSSDGYILTGTNAWDNEPEPEIKPEPSEVPGFPYLSIILGLLIVYVFRLKNLS